jgi:peroxiredoxin Q/BCP
MAALSPGDQAPDFQLLNQDGEMVKLADFRGKKLLLYFYPKASTPGCTVQACSIRDNSDKLEKLGVARVGISPDKPAAQKKFEQKQALNFPLLCDEDKQVAEAYGVWGTKKMYGKSYLGIIRSSFLIDEQGVITDCWYKVSPKDTVPGALAALS